MRLDQARRFYAIIAVATLGGVLLDFTPLNPMRVLLWSAVLNGIIAVPIMAVMMLVASDPRIMGTYVIRRRLARLGWAATAVMAITVVAMFVTL
jgi:Mn2+/Fe2+ NRAMP family transporter